jgi:eukaryotic-like serine/threonine-protein kinase
MTLATGTRLGPYEILAPLGAGGMGEVYRARDPRLGRVVALKILAQELSTDPEHLRRFEQEARSASALNHPNIVTVYEIGREDDVCFIAMELVEGRTLREILVEGALPAKRLLGIAVQIADGLAKAHAADIVHRDLKPENVMVSKDGFIKVLDFGLAKLVGLPDKDISQRATAAAPTKPGVVLGTVGYMSPEQAAGRTVDFRSDQFSLGSILYEMATGLRAFQKETAVETLSAIIRDEPEPIADAATAMPAPLHWIIERCLAKDPDDRYASTRDLARELAAVRDHLPQISRSGASPITEELPSRRRGSRGLWGVAGLAVGLAAAALLLPALRRTEAIDPPSIRFLTYSGHDRSPAVSPDGRTIAFSSDRDGRSRIWLKQLQGGGEAPLTAGPDDLPRFSPDGSSLLFIRGDQRPTLYRTALVGGEPRKLLENVVDADWSPDGRRIVTLSWEGEGPLATFALLPADGGEPAEIGRVPGRRVVHPRWSPDGRTIAASEGGTGGAAKSFFLIDVAEKRVRQLEPQSPSGSFSSVAWNGTGSDVLYLRSETAIGAVTGSAASVLLQNTVSGRSRSLLWTPSIGDVLDIAGPGRLVFDSRSLRENLQELPLKDGRVVGPGRWLTQGSATDRQPCYSADGEWVIFSSARGDNLDLWAVSTKSGVVRRLTEDAAQDWDPGFTRDGKKILWSSNRTGAFEIWMADPDGSGARQLTHDGLDAENPTATPDGRWIVYNQGNGAKRGITKIHPDGTGQTLIVPGQPLIPELSPDGRYVSYRLSLRPNLYEARVSRVEDGAPTAFAAPVSVVGSMSNSAARTRWMPDGKSIVYLGQDAGAWGLYVQGFDPARDTSATRRKLTGFDAEKATETFGISPDGSRLTIGAWEQVYGILVADRVPAVDPPPRPRPR